MKNRVVLFATATATLAALYFGVRPTPERAAPRVHAALPSQDTARTVLNSSHRHRQWVNVTTSAASIRAFIVYPERSNKAPVVVVSAARQSASEWIRAVADQVAADGFIAIVPDVLSGLGPNGGDTDAFPNAGAVANALERLGPAEIAQRVGVVREYALELPSANGQSASLHFDSPARRGSEGAYFGRIEAAVEVPGAAHAVFSPGGDTYLQAIAFLFKQTGDRPAMGVNPDMPEDHSAHFGMMMAQTSTGARAEGRGFPKIPNLPASGFNARGTLAKSKLHREFVDISMDNPKLHAWVEYPEGDGKAPIVIVMEHAPGLDDWQRALADQLAQDGFIAIAPDLNSGMGPNGGNFDSFADADAVSRSVARLTENDQLNRYKAARDWGMKLPRANGKSASIGFCMGGGNSFRFAAAIPELNAAVSFYGNPSRNFDFSRIKAPILAFYGEEDARVTSTLPATQSAMKENGKSFEAYTYPHTTHGFVEYQTLAENAAALADAWPKAIAFLKEHTM
jgi:carboxymethylenebutenolidase